MEVEYNVKLEEKEINALNELSKLNCEGVRCSKCPLFMEDTEHCIRYFAQKMKYQLQENGVIPWHN